MLAAYTFSSAQDLTAFCARHEIAGDQTYCVLQSHTSPLLDGDPYDDFRLTLVLDMDERALIFLAEEEAAYQHEKQMREDAAQDEQREQRILEQRAQWEATRRQGGPADDIPF